MRNPQRMDIMEQGASEYLGVLLLFLGSLWILYCGLEGLRIVPCLCYRVAERIAALIVYTVGYIYLLSFLSIVAIRGKSHLNSK
ncbi:hypothetical protein NEFER03_0008 [Nematocida sp. LUAm3]|nr:hypothetical protein NEFER03_0008 [Nematocida sp. LUAm3]KAI5173490.1 hypothetical protein NEFER02_0006 [Nematocida sp. LUAm2]KAI5176683.1 hypothetical protein NEFER01_0008 [Nematocida sp. LUAm1]